MNFPIVVKFYFLSFFSRNDSVLTPLFVRYPPQKVPENPKAKNQQSVEQSKSSQRDSQLGDTSIGGASDRSSSDHNQTSRSISSPDSHSSNDEPALQVMPVSTSSPKMVSHT